ncbi:hypothetical protein E2C01_037092 [Portunus trituberculatus]|uniref:Uncharacterized protein n=1 Tax=Portunus trituberculatus TaxID=210409 RepID=A0A5B7FG55_PORTR|nr:hypothetical protein [Portunus trituberculatus]
MGKARKTVIRGEPVRRSKPRTGTLCVLGGLLNLSDFVVPEQPEYRAAYHWLAGGRAKGDRGRQGAGHQAPHNAAATDVKAFIDGHGPPFFLRAVECLKGSGDALPDKEGASLCVGGDPGRAGPNPRLSRLAQGLAGGGGALSCQWGAAAENRHSTSEDWASRPRVERSLYVMVGGAPGRGTPPSEDTTVTS